MATATSTVSIKHQGKKYDVEFNTDTTGEDFKLQLFSLTNVEPSRQKVLIKGGQLKDDVSMGSLGLKKGQTIMMMGTPGSEGSMLVRPKMNVKFVEDMTEAEKAQHLGALPAGLLNLGNTCYLNSTLQTLRSIPELDEALKKYKPSSSSLGSELLVDLAAHLGSLFRLMERTQYALPPTRFLEALRGIFPQFAEKAKSNNGYAQQDAEEAWSQIVQQLRHKVKIGGPQGRMTASENGQSQTSEQDDDSFIDKYMAGEFISTMECEEEASSGGEQTVMPKEKFLKLDCHIDSSTNHLRDGMAALREKLEKRSEILGRDAVYTKTSKISRAPKYLTVHFVRFFWKRQTQKKAKIMRKVSFPQELDIVEFCSDPLKKALAPVRDKVREIRKDEEDMERSRKRRKKTHEQEMADIPGGSGLAAPSNKETKEVTQATQSKGKDESGKTDAAGRRDGATATETYKTDAQIDAEKEAALVAAKRELHSLLDESLRKDDGANQSGLYELRGVVTHQGASADSGHYTAYVRKSAPVDRKTGITGTEDGKWWWFNDDKVTEVTVDKVEALAGGGESHSALILLYQAIALPTAASTEQEDSDI